MSEAKARAKVARPYLTVAETIASEIEPRAWANVTVGNAVLAGIAASDAVCCSTLGRRSRGSDHRAAVDLLDDIDSELAKALSALLDLKDTAHYGEKLLVANKVTQAMRAADKLVTAAEAQVTGRTDPATTSSAQPPTTAGRRRPPPNRERTPENGVDASG